MEWLVELIVFRIVLLRKISTRESVDLFLVNFLTNPAANWLYQSGQLNFIQTESLVVLVESWLLASIFRVSFTRGFYYSIMANSASAMLGYLYVNVIY